MKKRVRQTDVARLAGVSPATVSLVINNRSGGSVRISEETRRRVIEAVNQLNYVVDPAARSLAGGQNYLLGVFTYESIFPLQHRDFYYRFLVGIEEEAEAIGYDLLLFTSSKGANGQRRVYNNGINRLGMADGAILLGASEDKTELHRLRQEGYTFVFIGRREVDGGPIAYVGADYAAATAAVVAHMVAHGHRRIAYIGQASQNESQLDRRQGYTAGLSQADIAVDPADMLLLEDHDVVSAKDLAALLARGVTGFVLGTGPIARSFVDAAQALGKQPPRDFSLALLGDPLEEYAMFPDVTMFKIPRRDMGAAAVRLLAQMLETDSPDPIDPNGRDGARQIMLPCRLIPGTTVGPAPLARP